MWAAKIRRDGKELRDAPMRLNVNEEYFTGLRTKSNAEFFTKVELLVKEPCSASYCHQEFSEVLLEPLEETILAILDSAILSKIPELKGLVLNYFDISAEAANICSHLLKSVIRIQSNCKFLQHAHDTTDDYAPDQQLKVNISELNMFMAQNNPFTNDPNKHDFKRIRDKYSWVLHHLKSMRKKVAWKLKLIEYFNKAFGIP
ncbi:UPF0496 protein 3 [Morella rubra]|uniref:UPF0496 protein 3 n=1 Tax=Morella rubra TaxID=262757 RepID=A0A6A1USI7_9ROSI|nr:UPF0496 protein 3 [Morella rubra]